MNHGRGWGCARAWLLVAALASGCGGPSPTTIAPDLAVSGPLATRVQGFETDLRAGRAEQAIARIDQAVAAAERGARSPDDYTELGYMLVRLGRGSEARRYLDLAVAGASEPRSHMLARIWSARAHVLLEDYAAAALDYEAALVSADRIPGGTPTLMYATVDVTLADVMRLRGDCSRAALNYERLSKLSNPRNMVGPDRDLAHRVWARAETGWARCELEQGRADLAERRASELEQWLRERRDDRGRPYLELVEAGPELLRLLSDVALTKGDLATAKQQRSRSAELVLADAEASLDPASLDALLDAAWFALATGDASASADGLAQLRTRLERQGIRGGILVGRVAEAEGAIALHRGELERARNSLVAAVAIHRAEGLERSLAKSLPLLASAELGLGETGSALTSAREAVELASRHRQHEAAAALAFARASWAVEGGETSLSAWTQLDALEERRLRETMMYAGSEAQRVILARQTPMIDIASTLAATGGPAAVKFGFEAVLRRKGRLLDAAASTLGSLDARSGATQTKLRQIAGLRAEVSRLSLSPPAGLSPEEIASQTAALTKQIAGIEASLGDDVSWVTRAKQLEAQLGWSDLQAALEPGEALIEYVDYAVYSPTSGLGPERWIGAYVLRSAGEPRFVALAPAAEVSAAVRQLREALAGRQAWEQPAAELSALAVTPLLAELDSVQRIRIAPDGALNLVPFAVLGAGPAALHRSHELSYLSAGRDLVVQPPVNAFASEPLVLAAPSYDRAGGGASGGGQRSARMQGIRFTPLPGTRTEGEAIAKLLAVDPQLDEAAAEHLLKQARGPRILHIATHGFFLDADEAAARLGSRGLVLVEAEGAAASLALDDNPLLRTGLALAGANGGGQAGEDGVLTGLEAASLDLRGTQLVVLSACETGVGEVDAGEGVYGLRRAFQLAASETQVISLWEVDDRATELLMRSFYANLSKGQGRSEALRTAQDQLRRKPEYAHPYYWAAFILSGERGPLRD